MDVVSDTTTLDKFKNNASILLDKYNSANKIRSINYKAPNQIIVIYLLHI